MTYVQYSDDELKSYIARLEFIASEVNEIRKLMHARGNACAFTQLCCLDDYLPRIEKVVSASLRKSKARCLVYDNDCLTQ